MKKYLFYLLILFYCSSLQISCNSFDDRIQIANQYFREHINEFGHFNVKVLDFSKVNGESFQSGNISGLQMYGLEFIAECECLENGYVIKDKDGIVRDLRLLTNIYLINNLKHNE